MFIFWALLPRRKQKGRMRDGCRIFGNGKSSKTTKKNQQHKLPSGLGYPKPEGRDKGESYTLFRTLPECFFLQEKGHSPSLENSVLATPIRFLSYHQCSESPCVWSVVRCALGSYRRESASFVERLKTQRPTNRRKTRFVGSCIIS